MGLFKKYTNTKSVNETIQLSELETKIIIYMCYKTYVYNISL